MLHPVPTRAAAASEFPRPDHNHATQLRQGSLCALPHRQRLAQPSPTRNPLDCAAGSFCPSASPHLAGSALPAVLFRPSTAVHRESLVQSQVSALLLDMGYRSQIWCRDARRSRHGLARWLASPPPAPIRRPSVLDAARSLALTTRKPDRRPHLRWGGCPGHQLKVLSCFFQTFRVQHCRRGRVTKCPSDGLSFGASHPIQ